MKNKRKISILCICMLVLGVFFSTGCGLLPLPKSDRGSESEIESSEESSKSSESSEENDDNVIVAGSVDTSSKFSFSVEEAIIGISYSDEPIVVLAGTFTNNSDETISFSWALEATAVQDGYKLSTAYLSGSSDYNYNEIAPGSTIPIFIAWEIIDGESDITLTVIDSQHYAKEEVYSNTFTIDELISNTEKFQGAEEIIEEAL